MLKAARTALGADWRPRGAVLEGDVKSRMYKEAGFLNVFVQEWNGEQTPAHAYKKLDQYVRRFQ
jgi:hypothetical protein